MSTLLDRRRVPGSVASPSRGGPIRCGARALVRAPRCASSGDVDVDARRQAGSRVERGDLLRDWCCRLRSIRLPHGTMSAGAAAAACFSLVSFCSMPRCRLLVALFGLSPGCLARRQSLSTCSAVPRRGPVRRVPGRGLACWHAVLSCRAIHAATAVERQQQQRDAAQVPQRNSLHAAALLERASASSELERRAPAAAPCSSSAPPPAPRAFALRGPPPHLAFALRDAGVDERLDPLPTTAVALAPRRVAPLQPLRTLFGGGRQRAHWRDRDRSYRPGRAAIATPDRS